VEIVYSDHAKQDIDYWKRSGNTAIQKRISALIRSIAQTPFEGIGKPEPLKHNLSGAWSRRINKEHRLVYEVEIHEVIILSIRGHYELAFSHSGLSTTVDSPFSIIHGHY
jgi:toxin YoeB